MPLNHKKLLGKVEEAKKYLEEYCAAVQNNQENQRKFSPNLMSMHLSYMVQLAESYYNELNKLNEKE